MIEIIPAILATSWHDFVEMVRKIEPHTERVHLDILDGAFVNTAKTIYGYEELQAVETKLAFDVHLMVMHPEEFIPQWLMTKADRFFLHAESDGHLGDMLLEIRNQGKKAGIVLNPETPTGSILEYLPVIDYVQFMTVHPGSYGRPFLTDMLDKISTFHDSYPEMPIAVDGGINPNTTQMAIGAGAEIIISGSYIMNSPDPAKAIAELKDGFK